MRCPLVRIFIAALTFAIGVAASALLGGALKPTSESVHAPSASFYVELQAPPHVRGDAGTSVAPCQCIATDSFDPNGPADGRLGRVVQGGVLNGKAVSLPKPQYPPMAKAAHASGAVVVEIYVDRNGNVCSARAVSGHPLLQIAAVQAARQAKLSPTWFSGTTVCVKGYLTYNFVLQ